MATDADRWARIEELCQAALDLDESQQSDLLDSACGMDQDLRRQVESLLVFRRDAERFIETPAMEIAAKAMAGEAAPSSNSTSPMIGKLISHYRIVEEIGAGGMGEVYRAVRADDQYKKEVAIKLVRAGQDSRFVVARFRNERQVLASLDHPNIARLLDGGTTDDGIPYFVMELIDGRPLTQYCDEHKLSVTERLNVFLQVCSAVQYAHQRLIVHRDLKPSNILVTAEGTPKLLDFGIAKLLGPAGSAETADATQSMFRLLTPAYASPEQIKGETITTASDVYSLGVVLYECLTGHHPHQGHANSPHEISRAVCEVDPEKPSTAIRRTETRTAGDQTTEITPASVSVVRDGTPEKLAKRLRGDVDNIILMALRKEPQRRYSSVEQFANDIRRHLENLPVTATGDMLHYRITKFIARHKTGVAAAVALFVAVLAGISATLYEGHLARLNQLRAEKRFNDVRALANSLLFDIHDSIRDLPGSTPARKMIIERALRYLDSLATETGGDPSLERELATAYERIGEVQGDYIFFNLGETENALRNYQKALSLRQNVASSKSATWKDQLALAKSYRLVAAQMRVTGNVPAAFENVDKAISICEILRDTHPQDTQVLAELRTAQERKGHIQRGSWSQASPGNYAAALESFSKAIEIDTALLKLDPNNEGFQFLAGADEMYYAEVLPPGREAEKLEHFQHVLEIDKKINEHNPTPEHAHAFAEDYNRIAMWYDGQRDHVKSAETHRRYLEIVEQLYAADQKNMVLKQEVVIGSANLGIELGFIGQKKEGGRLLDRAVTLMRSIAQADPQNRSHQGVLAAALVMRGDNFLHWKSFRHGIDDYESAINIYRQLLTANPNNTAARQRLLICRLAVVHTRLQTGSQQNRNELETALADLNPFLSEARVNDDALYAEAVGYADLGNIEFAAAHNAVPASSKSHWESAARWYGLSLGTLKRVQNLAGEAESEAFGPLDPGFLSKRLVICQSAARPASDLATRTY